MTRRSARLLLVNMHATSKPAVVVPWLVALCLALRVDAVLLQECTDRHARWLARLPRWTLVRDGGDEAILGRRKRITEQGVVHNVSGTWQGHHTGETHPARTLPLALLDGWLRLGSVHFPPGWENGPADRRAAGLLYIIALRVLTSHMVGAVLLGGDYNALATSRVLTRWRAARKMNATGPGIKHASHRGVSETRQRRVGRAPGMDHDAVLVTVKE